MFRTEIYLREDQASQLKDLSYLKSKQMGKRLGISELIREALDSWLKPYRKKLDETDKILRSRGLLEDLGAVKAEIKKGKLLTRKEAIGR